MPHQTRFQPVAQLTDERWRNRTAPLAVFFPVGPEGMPGSKSWNPFAYPGLSHLLQGLKRAEAAKISSSCFWLPVLLPLPSAQEGRRQEPEPHGRLSLAALGWPNLALASGRQLFPAQSLAQLSAVAAKLKLKAKVLYLEMYIQERKKSLIFFLKSTQKMQGATRTGWGTPQAPLLCSEVLSLIQNWASITRILPV